MQKLELLVDPRKNRTAEDVGREVTDLVERAKTQSIEGHSSTVNPEH